MTREAQHTIGNINGATITATTAGDAITYPNPPSRLGVEMNIASIGGTSPTFRADVQGTLDGTNWFDLLTGTSRTANGRYFEVVAEASLAVKQVRVNLVVGGTTPTAAVTIKFVARIEY